MTTLPLPQQLPPNTVVDPTFYDLPWFLSYPRSGSHWINCALEFYSQRRRVFLLFQNMFRNKPISILPESVPFDNYMWVQSHFTKNPIKSAIYIIRDPVDVMFSYGTAQKKLTTDVETTNFLYKNFQNYIKNVTKWALTPETKAQSIVRYENFVTSPSSEFKKVVDFFGLSWDEGKAIDALNQASKGNLAKNAKRMVDFFNEGLDSPEYADTRSKFRERFGSYIYDNVLKDGLQTLFTPKG